MLFASLLNPLHAEDEWPRASRDIELVRPEFSPGSVPGVESLYMDRSFDLRVGTLLQYERQPIVYSFGGDYDGDAVRDRFITTLGASFGVSRRVAIRVGFPVAFQGGGTGGLAATGLAAGDLDTGVRGILLRAGPVRVGGSMAFTVPIGTAAAWMSEPLPRVTPEVLGQVELGRFTVLGNVAAVLRMSLGNTLDFTSGPTLNVGAALRYDMERAPLAFGAAFVGRTALGKGGFDAAETPAELVGSVELGGDGAVVATAGGGVGVSGGVGAARVRALAGVTWVARLPKPKRRPRVPLLPDLGPDDEEIARAEEEEDEPPEEEPCVVVRAPVAVPDRRPWATDELVRAEQEEIVLRDPIQFAFGTDEILPESTPTLTAMATLLRDDVSIRGLLIEGHTSDEGGFAYNFELSDRRARAVFRVLVAAGVHPARLSYRGMGEVAPPPARPDAEDVATHRRVVFRIVSRALVRDPEGFGDVVVPWTGEVVQPAPPPPPPEPPARPAPLNFDEEEE